MRETVCTAAATGQLAEVINIMPHGGTTKAGGRLLEPSLLTLDIGSYKFFVGFSKVDDAFDYTENITQPACQQADHKLNYALGRVAQNELMDAGPAEQNSADARHDLLVGTHRLPVCHCS